MNRKDAAIVVANMEIIKAYAEGKTIEYRGQLLDEWEELHLPNFNSIYGEYRVKPEPRKVWIVEYNGGIKILCDTIEHLDPNSSYIKAIHGPFELKD